MSHRIGLSFALVNLINLATKGNPRVILLRFREIAERIASLREQQDKERTWQENMWQAESKIHERIGDHHRQVDAQT